MNLSYVVNCFQIVSLRYWWHRREWPGHQRICCELLSDCIFEVLVTPRNINVVDGTPLWIAFRLYLWGIGDTIEFWFARILGVVNCFQIVSLRYWWHLSVSTRHHGCRCELLSDCIFEVLVTPSRAQFTSTEALWIAFRLYLWGIGDTMQSWYLKLMPVVNCFQIVSLRYWWHLITSIQYYVISCELLSDCIFEVLVTPNVRERFLFTVLWIAFRLYLWGIGDT